MSMNSFITNLSIYRCHMGLTISFGLLYLTAILFKSVLKSMKLMNLCVLRSFKCSLREMGEV